MEILRKVEELEIQLHEMINGVFDEDEEDEKEDQRFRNMEFLSHQFLENKKALINPKNNDNECFKWCVGRHFLWEFHPERITEKLKKFVEEEFDWTGVSFPISWRDVGQFERKIDISVNVLG